MSRSTPNSLTFEVHGLQYAALTWGDPAQKPLLAVHGWLDNAASFSFLAPYLSDYYVVAIDLSGHGLSSRRSPDATYQLYDDIPQIAGVVELLGWKTFSLLGHSRGAIIGTIYAATFAEQIEKLVLLDAIVTPPLSEDEFISQMRRFVTDKARLLSRKTRVYPSVESAVDARASEGLAREAAAVIVNRNLVSCEGGFTWTTDPRLRGASAIKLSMGQTRCILESLTAPTLFLPASNGILKRQEILKELVPLVANLEQEWIQGGHHFHMEPGVATLADRIQRFLQG